MLSSLRISTPPAAQGCPKGADAHPIRKSKFDGQPTLGAARADDSSDTSFFLDSRLVRGFLAPLRTLGSKLYAVPIPSEGSLALSAAETAEAARSVGFEALERATPLEAVRAALAAAPAASADAPLRIVICGSLYLAGWVLQENGTATASPSKSKL